MSKSIGEMIKDRREEMGLTQLDCAKHLHLSSPQYISNIERGLCFPSLETVVKLAEILKMDGHKLVDYMLEEHAKKVRAEYARLLKRR
jgi:transcriptional regulator with XRE-family HTH domain